MLIDIMCCVQWLWLRQNHWTLNIWALIMNNHYGLGKGYTKKITRIVKAALHKLPGKSSLNIRSVCPRGERIMFWWPKTNTNIIRVPKNDRRRIRILFGSPKLTKYEYEYYLGFQKWPDTNTNIIRRPKNDQIRIRILFGFPKMTEYEYEYYSVSQKWPNMNTNIIWLSKNDQIQIQILFGFQKRTEYQYEYYSEN